MKELAPSQLESLVNAGKSVYVVNSSKLPSGDKGTIIVNFYDGNRREFFKIPPTFIPMAVTDTIPAERLTKSRDFKQCLVKGMLTLIDPDSAEDYLSSDEAREEYESLMLSEHSSRTVQPAPTRVENESVGNRVRATMEMYKSDTKTVEEVIRELRRHKEALSIADIGHVKANATDRKLMDFADKLLEERHESKQAVAAVPAKPKKIEDDIGFDFDSSYDPNAEKEVAGTQILDGRSSKEDVINSLMGRK